MTNQHAYRMRRPLAPLWRSSGQLQLGADPELILDGVPADVARAVELWRRPHTERGLARLLPDLGRNWVSWLRHQLASADLLVAESAPRPDAVAVVGTGDLADALVESLTLARLGGVRRIASGVESPVVPHWSRLDTPWPALTLVATGSLEPDRMLTDELFRSDAAHLVVRAGDARAAVGPLVVPGATACVRCMDLARCRLDGDWPKLLAQLCRKPASAPPHLAAWSVATATAQAKALLDGHQPDATARVISLDGWDNCLRAEDVLPHPDCACTMPAPQ
ncbi:MAG: hypothetical protein LBR32_08355 [Propionibacteriaceae bacterium]|nr:hypothetical protein [Propionibacteriaceae bacterium]